jgi:hypothetical protein
MDVHSAFGRTIILVEATHAQAGRLLDVLSDMVDRIQASRQMVKESRELLILVDDLLRRR